jgi:hypothetical protein
MKHVLKFMMLKFLENPTIGTVLNVPFPHKMVPLWERSKESFLG